MLGFGSAKSLEDDEEEELESEVVIVEIGGDSRELQRKRKRSNGKSCCSLKSLQNHFCPREEHDSRSTIGSSFTRICLTRLVTRLVGLFLLRKGREELGLGLSLTMCNVLFGYIFFSRQCF